ncbi:MAG: response regulator transcription factor [Dehalococcoidales bacterium]|nr:response regulator transcription factor [Dehalococcoidales bacterium]
MHQTTILVADDDPSVSELLYTSLGGEGWKLYSAFNGDEAIKAVHENTPDLVILDINMPGIDGIEVCRHIAATSRIPVIMLTAQTDLKDEEKCLSLGADDYITKPFRTGDLIARVKAVLRRRQENSARLKSPFVSGDLEIEFVAESVRLRGREVRLSHTEYLLLEELALNAGKALTNRYLLHKVWGPEYSGERQYLHVYIGRLRAKIEPTPENPVFIITVPGTGYRFETELQ